MTGINQVEGLSFNSDLIKSEHAQYGNNLYTSTFVPKLGMVLKGDHSNSYFGMDDAPLYYAQHAIAQMKLQTPDTRTWYQASKNDPDS